jgi:hypothetical protein
MSYFSKTKEITIRLGPQILRDNAASMIETRQGKTNKRRQGKTRLHSTPRPRQSLRALIFFRRVRFTVRVRVRIRVGMRVRMRVRDRGSVEFDDVSLSILARFLCDILLKNDEGMDIGKVRSTGYPNPNPKPKPITITPTLTITL